VINTTLLIAPPEFMPAMVDTRRAKDGASRDPLSTRSTTLRHEWREVVAHFQSVHPMTIMSRGRLLNALTFSTDRPHDFLAK
jgi:hypothetical protein